MDDQQGIVIEQPYYPPPHSYDFSRPDPPVIADYDPRLESELGEGNFLRDARWSPDGSSLLTVGEDRTIRTFSIPHELLSLSLASAPPALPSTDQTFTPNLTLPQQSAIYSTLWYPSASLAMEGSFCFLAAGEGTTIRLIDGVDGRIRASYPIIDHRERFVAPHSMAFNLDASKLYCGFDSAIEVFDFSRPGAGERILTSASKKTKGGQKGIISALAFSPHQPGLYAAGTYTRTISLYDESSRSKQQLFNIKGIEGAGVTQLKFHPSNPNVLFASSRRSPSLVQSWDLRSPKKPLTAYARPERAAGGSKGGDGGRKGSNQRMGFDVDLWGRWLVAGDMDGIVSFFDISEEGTQPGEDGKTKAEFTFRAGNDAVPSVSLHPYLPLLATSTGARHFPPTPPSSDSDSSSDKSSSSSEESEEDEGAAKPMETEEVEDLLRTSVSPMKRPLGGGGGGVRGSRVRVQPLNAALKIWDFANRPEEVEKEGRGQM